MGNVSIVFCSDAYLLNLNKKFLNHDFFTDIITFDYCEGDVLSGDILISVDSVRANAVEYGVSFEEELARVMVHGVLHLVGYDDHSDEEVRVMRAKEDFYLAKREGVLI
ncbi:MAG: rRNA maturation RNase YbeY [Bacteroidales bacterium]|nr:rRNA maturation RNase YbeY [Bacteroidales bacterium]